MENAREAASWAPPGQEQPRAEVRMAEGWSVDRAALGCLEFGDTVPREGAVMGS